MATYSKRLTDKLVEKITPPAQGQDEYFDSLLSNFSLRIGISSKKSFYILFRSPHNGKVARLKVGSYPALKLGDARDKAKAYFEHIQKGIDPRFEKKLKKLESKKRLTLKELSDKFIAAKNKVLRKPTWREYARILNREFVDLHDIPADSIDPDHIQAILKEIEERAPIQADSAFRTLSSLDSWARQERYIKSSLIGSSRRPQIRANKRDRVLNNDEIKAIWNACDVIGYPFGPLFQMMFILGRRRQVVSLMKWKDINFDEAVWSIPSEDDKSKTPHAVPLPKLAIDILKNIPRFDTEYVFTTNSKTAVSGFSKAKQKIDELSGVSDWVLHDTRRVVRTNLSKIGISPDIAKLTLGHAVQGIDAVYDRYSYFPQRKNAISAWANKLEEITADKVFDNVVALHG